MVSDEEGRDTLKRVCLNPCCNGIWSQTHFLSSVKNSKGLNPCCNGIWSQTIDLLHADGAEYVLILVVMEYGLRLQIRFSISIR